VIQRNLQTRLAHTPSEELAKILEEDGCVVLKDFASAAQIKAITGDMEPYIEATMRSNSEFGGFKTTRTGALMARSPSCRELAIDQRILDLVEAFLAPYANTFQLHVTQVIRVLPGEEAQMQHRDRWAWSQLQTPPNVEPQTNNVLAKLMTEIEPQLNIMLALTDFTSENGATLVAPGSPQLPDDTKLPEEAFVSAEMTSGSMLVFSGAVLHGAGANNSKEDRVGLNIDYTLGWLRQEDNQYLSCPPEIAKDLDPKLQALLGYTVGGPSLGYFTPPLPAGADLSSPKRALQETGRPLRLDAEGRPEFFE
jgi:ectoine hydroxylase-related dioxygenase (phytanoyl-CoA dioxygenase family)